METLKMSEKERRRLEVMSRVRGGELKLVKAAELLGRHLRARPISFKSEYDPVLFLN